MIIHDHPEDHCPVCDLRYLQRDRKDRREHWLFHHRVVEYGRLRGYPAFTKRASEHLKSHGRNIYRAAPSLEAKVLAAGMVARARYEWAVTAALLDGPVSDLLSMRSFVLAFPWENEFGNEVADALRAFWRDQPATFLPEMPEPLPNSADRVNYTWPTSLPAEPSARR